MSEYEKVHFDKWQDLAKAVIDGGEFYCDGVQITCGEEGFNFILDDSVLDSCSIKKQPTLEELIAIKPRLCWVWDSCDKKKRLRLLGT